MPAIIEKAAEGNVFPTPSELHSPNVTADHVKELGVYLKAHSVGIADLGKQPAELAHGYLYGVVCAIRADYDPYTSPGVGGGAAIQAGQYATFIVASWIREMGFRASMKIAVSREDRERLAVAAGLGKLNSDGRLSVPKLGTRVYIADIIFTDLPLMADG